MIAADLINPSLDPFLSGYINPKICGLISGTKVFEYSPVTIYGRILELSFHSRGLMVIPCPTEQLTFSKSQLKKLAITSERRYTKRHFGAYHIVIKMNWSDPRLE